jgi:hypothetical protein
VHINNRYCVDKLRYETTTTNLSGEAPYFSDAKGWTHLERVDGKPAPTEKEKNLKVAVLLMKEKEERKEKRSWIPLFCEDRDYHLWRDSDSGGSAAGPSSGSADGSKSSGGPADGDNSISVDASGSPDGDEDADFNLAPPVTVFRFSIRKARWKPTDQANPVEDLFFGTTDVNRYGAEAYVLQKEYERYQSPRLAVLPDSDTSEANEWKVCRDDGFAAAQIQKGVPYFYHRSTGDVQLEVPQVLLSTVPPVVLFWSDVLLRCYEPPHTARRKHLLSLFHQSLCAEDRQLLLDDSIVVTNNTATEAARKQVRKTVAAGSTGTAAKNSSGSNS